MSKNNKNNKDEHSETRDECIPVKGDEIEIIKIMRIKRIPESQTRRAECGSVIKRNAKELLEPEYFERMRCEYFCGIISKCDNINNITASRAYKIN